MTSWRDTTAQPVQEDLDALVTLAVDHAHHLLKKNGEFFPFGVAMSDEGEDYFFSADPGLGCTYSLRLRISQTTLLLIHFS